MARTEPFEMYPGRYDDWFVVNRLVYGAELQAVAALLPKYGKGVEIGVGTGRFAAPLGVRFGVDPSPVMCQLAQRRGIAVIEAVGEALPFREESFDFVLMVTTLCFVDDARRSLEEAHRILRPGGCIVVAIVDKESPLGRVYQGMKSASVFYRVATFYSTDEVKQLLAETGFGRIEIVETVFGNLEEIDELQGFREGRGEGGFVAMRAMKRSENGRNREDRNHHM